MMGRFFEFWNWLINTVNRFDAEHWAIAFAILLVIGLICMRGYAIRGAS